MKRIVAVAAACIFAGAFVFLGCSKKVASDGRLTVRLVTDATGIDDMSFNAAAWRGIVQFYGDTLNDTKARGTLYDVITCQTQDMYVPNLKQAADRGYDLIIATGFTFANAVDEVAPLYPDQKFMIVDVDWLDQPNLAQYSYAEEQGSFLVGAAAALQAQAENVAMPKFGFIGGVPGGTITKFEVGYIQGIRAVIPEAEIVDYYANSWGAPEKAKAQAKNWYDAGVYAVFSAAGGTGNGAIAQAKEYRAQGKNVWAIGVDSDQWESGKYAEGKSVVLTSMIKKVETASITALKEIESGNFSGGVHKLALADDGLDYSLTNAELKPEVAEAVNAMKADIIGGKIKVLGTYKESLAAGLVPDNLGAKDD